MAVCRLVVLQLLLHAMSHAVHDYRRGYYTVHGKMSERMSCCCAMHKRMSRASTPRCQTVSARHRVVVLALHLLTRALRSAL